MRSAGAHGNGARRASRYALTASRTSGSFNIRACRSAGARYKTDNTRFAMILAGTAQNSFIGQTVHPDPGPKRPGGTFREKSQGRGVPKTVLPDCRRAGMRAIRAKRAVSVMKIGLGEAPRALYEQPCGAGRQTSAATETGMLKNCFIHRPGGAARRNGLRRTMTA